MNIIYQDEHILVLNKPAGIPVLPDGWEKDAPYLLQMLEADHSKLWVVHRLDKFTSGVMVFARNAESHRALNIQFENREAEKVYHAIVEGNPKWDEKVAKFPLRTNVGNKHRTAVDNKNGKPSETRFRVIRRYQAHADDRREGRSAALIEAKPTTGRTHQIRVHAYAMGNPLLGDVLYGAEETNMISRPALHAHALTLTHPATNNRITFTAERPDDFATALKQLHL